MIEEEGIETLNSILGLCGFFDDDTSSVTAEKRPRFRLMECVKRLDVHLAKVPLQIQDSMNEALKCSLLETESSIETFRKEAEVYLDELELQNAEIVDLTTEFQEQNTPDSWIILCRTIQLAYSMQNQREEQAVRELMKDINNIYVEDDANNVRKRIDSLSTCLRRDDLLQRIDLLDLISLIRDPGGRRDIPRGSSPKKPEARCPRGRVKMPSMYSFVGGAGSALEATHHFYRSIEKQNSSLDTSVTSILVVGEQGSGKTHICNQVNELLKESCTVLRPQLPLDLLGRSVGETEDTIVSIFTALRSNRTAVLLLDGLEHILADDLIGEDDVRSDHQRGVLVRSASTFLCLLDSIKRTALADGTNILVLCTSTRESDALCNRFDRVFRLEPPSDAQRRELFERVFLADGSENATNDGIKCLLDDLVEATMGRTFAELDQYCRQTLEQLGLEHGILSSTEWSESRALRALKERLQTATPESLKSGVLADSVEMRILTARDMRLLKPSSSNGQEAVSCSFSMKGLSASKAWAELNATIVVPLCRSKELSTILCQGSALGGIRGVTGGVLLHGESGSGKSEIAIHCARHASWLLPTLKTLEVGCTSLIHKEIGGSERAITRLFHSARKAAPCILILDGIENIASVRGNDPTTEGTLDRVLSTLLTEMDGIDTTGSETGGIVVVGITNNAQWIDPALKRPGRLEKTLLLERDWN